MPRGVIHLQCVYSGAVFRRKSNTVDPRAPTTTSSNMQICLSRASRQGTLPEKISSTAKDVSVHTHAFLVVDGDRPQCVRSNANRLMTSAAVYHILTTPSWSPVVHASPPGDDRTVVTCRVLDEAYRSVSISNTCSRVNVKIRYKTCVHHAQPSRVYFSIRVNDAKSINWHIRVVVSFVPKQRVHGEMYQT